MPKSKVPKYKCKIFDIYDIIRQMIKVGKRKLYKYHINSLQRRAGGNYFKVLKRDKYQCAICGNKDFPMVHHLDGNLQNNKLNNLLTVCRKCHAELHGQTLKFNKPTFSLIKELRQQNKTYQEIGNYLGVSRQRIHQIVKRGREEGFNIP